MGGAFLARPDDSTAVSWNPAGLSYLRSPEVSAVGTYGSLRIRTVNSDGSPSREDRRSGRSPDFAAATYPIEIASFSGSAQLSFQRAISFDFTRTIDLPPTVRQFESHGGFDVVALGAGLQVSRRLRAGLAANRWLNGYAYTLDRQGGRPSRQTTRFGFGGWNLNAGLIWSPTEAVNLGAVYKTAFTAAVELSRDRADFPFPSAPVEPAGVPVSTNQYRRDDVRLDFPSAFGVGVSWRPGAPITISADYTRTRWSTGRIHNYFTLPPSGVPSPPDDRFDELPYPSLLSGQAQRDSEQFRVGIEHVLFLGGLKWPLRAGYLLDRQLFLTFDEESGSVDKTPLYQGFTAGTGVSVGRVLIDVAYLQEFGNYREVDVESTDRVPRRNDVRAHRISVSVIYRHRR